MPDSNFDLNKMLELAMNDPAVAELAKSLRAGAESQGVADVAPSGGGGTPLPPELLEKLPDIMSVLGPAAGGSHGESSKEVERRNRLLAAMKPYVNNGRRDMIDKIMSLSKITTLLDILPKKDS